GKVYRIAIVHPSAPVADMSEMGEYPAFPAFFTEFRRLGYVEGRNLAVERHSGEGPEGNFANIARNVIRAKPDVVITSSNTLVLAFKEITDTPVVAVMSDPVAYGIVNSLSRPGGNITGISVDAGLASLSRKTLTKCVKFFESRQQNPPSKRDKSTGGNHL